MKVSYVDGMYLLFDLGKVSYSRTSYSWRTTGRRIFCSQANRFVCGIDRSGVARRGSTTPELCLAATAALQRTRSATKPARQVIAYWSCRIAATDGMPLVSRMNNM